MDIVWLIAFGSLISTCLTRWFDLFNHNPLEQKHRGRIWLIRIQVLQILWASVHARTEHFLPPLWAAIKQYITCDITLITFLRNRLAFYSRKQSKYAALLWTDFIFLVLLPEIAFCYLGWIDRFTHVRKIWFKIGKYIFCWIPINYCYDSIRIEWTALVTWIAACLLLL